MADILDINSVADFDLDEEGEKGIASLKDKVKKRKGRGFGIEQTEHDKINGYDRIEVEGADKPGPKKSVESSILFIISVDEEASEEDLYEKFSEYGVIKNICIYLNRRTGFLKGYALIEYRTIDEANNARQSLDGSDILGQPIGVDRCFLKGPKKNWKRNRKQRSVVDTLIGTGSAGDH